MNQVEVKSRQIQALVNVLGMVTWLILGRMVGFHGVAYFAAALEGFLIFYYLLAGRLPKALGQILRSRYAKGQYKNAQKVKSSVLFFQAGLGVLGGVLLFFLAPVIAEKVFLIPYAALALRILAPALVIRVVIHIFLGYLQGNGTQMPTMVVHVLRQLLYIGFAFLFVGMLREYGEKVQYLLLNDLLPSMYGAAGMAISVAVTELLLLLFVLFLYFVSKKAQKRQTEGLKRTEGFLGAVGSLYGAMGTWILTDLMIHLPVWLGMVLYLRNTEGSQEAIINYGKYYGGYLAICMIPIFVCTALLSPLAPRTAKALRRKEHQYAKALFGAGFHMGVVLTLFPVVYLCVLSTQISHMLQKTKGPADILGKMLLIGSAIVAFTVLARFCVNCIQYLGKMNLALGMLGLYVIVFTVSITVFLRVMKLEAEGLVYAGLTALFVLCLTSAVYLLRYLHLKPQYLSWFGIPAMAALVSGLICYLLGRFATPHMGYIFTVVVGFLVGLLVYWIILLALKTFRRQELEMIPGGRLIESLSALFPGSR